jgi:hypothetical protein
MDAPGSVYKIYEQSLLLYVYAALFAGDEVVLTNFISICL